MNRKWISALMAAGLLLGGCAAKPAESAGEQEGSEQKEFVIHTCDMGFQGVPYLYELRCTPDGAIEELVLKTDFASTDQEVPEPLKEDSPVMLAEFASSVFPQIDKEAAAANAVKAESGEYEIVFPYADTASQAGNEAGNEAGNTYEEFKSWFDAKGFLTTRGCE